MAVPNLWRTKKQRYSLQGEVCPACSSAIFPPRKVCPYCGSSMGAPKPVREPFVFARTYNTPQVFLSSPAGDD